MVDVDSLWEELLDVASEGEDFADGRRGDVGHGGRGEEHHGGQRRIDAVVGGLHRSFVLEVGGVSDAADDGAGADLLGEFAGETGVDAGLDAGFVAEDVGDQPFAVFDGQQPAFGGIVADADDHAVEEVQGLVDQCFVSAGEGVERPREYRDSFHIGQR